MKFLIKVVFLLFIWSYVWIVEDWIVESRQEVGMVLQNKPRQGIAGANRGWRDFLL